MLTVEEGEEDWKKSIWSFELGDVADTLQNFELACRNLAGGPFCERWVVAESVANFRRGPRFADCRPVQGADNEKGRHL